MNTNLRKLFYNTTVAASRSQWEGKKPGKNYICTSNRTTKTYIRKTYPGSHLLLVRWCHLDYILIHHIWYGPYHYGSRLKQRPDTERLVTKTCLPMLPSWGVKSTKYTQSTSDSQCLLQLRVKKYTSGLWNIFL